MKTLAWIVLTGLALIMLGWVVVKVLSALFSVALYLLVGAAVVGGGWYLVGKARRGIGSTPSDETRRLP